MNKDSQLALMCMYYKALEEGFSPVEAYLLLCRCAYFLFSITKQIKN